MHACKRNLLAVAIAALLAPALAFADKPTGTGHGKPTSSATMGEGHARDATDRSPKPNSSAAQDHNVADERPRASDADDKNARDDMDDDDDADDINDGDDAADDEDNRSTSNPGKGNWWNDIDGDNDGRISRAEAGGNAGLDSRFASVDADGDGFVTSDEYRAYYTANASQGAEYAQDHSAVVTRDVWKRFDANADGSLTAAEIDADAKLKADFGGIDADHDGLVSNDEYRAYYKDH